MDQEGIDTAITAHLSHAGVMGVGPLFRAIGKPYTTVMVHVLALAAAGKLHIEWRGRDRYVGLADEADGKREDTKT